MRNADYIYKGERRLEKRIPVLITDLLNLILTLYQQIFLYSLVTET